MNRKHNTSSELQINPALSDKDKGFLPFESRRSMAEILPIRSKTLSKQSIHLKNTVKLSRRNLVLVSNPETPEKNFEKKKLHFRFKVRNIAHEWFTNQVII